jgi:excisionase family DNA binding protein
MRLQINFAWEEKMEYEKYLDVKELAAMFGLSVATVRRWVFDRAIPYQKFGRLVRFSLTEVKEWAKSRAVNPVVRNGNEGGRNDCGS